MQNIPSSWLEGQNLNCLNVFDRIVDNIVSTQKVPRISYSTLFEKCAPDKRICFWQDLSEEDPEHLDWEDIHLRSLLILVLDPFISRSFIMLLLLMNFCLKL